MSPIVVYVLIGVIGVLVGVLVGYIIRKNIGEKAIGSAEQKARNLILDAQNKSETIKKEITLEAKEEAHRMRTDAEREVKERRAEIQRAERRMIQKEESLDKKLENIEKREESITKHENEILAKKKELEGFVAKQIEELEKILKNAEVVDEDEVDLDRINIGCKVRILDVEYNEECEYKIVGSTEANSLKGKISNESPVGKALIGKKQGDTIVVETPAGSFQYKVLEIQRSN